MSARPSASGLHSRPQPGRVLAGREAAGTPAARRGGGWGVRNGAATREGTWAVSYGTKTVLAIASGTGAKGAETHVHPKAPAASRTAHLGSSQDALQRVDD